MRVDRLLRVIALIAMLMLAPSPVLADHCGAAATVSPRSGPPGTTFIFETNLGAASDLRLYRNGRLVAAVALDGDSFVRYEIRTGPGDVGTWRARAEVRGQSECAAEATFTVGGTPDTSLSPELSSEPSASILIVVAIGLVAFATGIRRFGRGQG
jgi:hypothetical protein